MSRPGLGPSRALVVFAHPRPDSLTAATAARARDTLVADGYTVDLLDLYREGFDPSLFSEDEPDWADPTKEYSAQVRAQMARVAAADVIVVVFPVWWYGLPAMAKGWVDRVWNRGFAYEPSTLHGKRMLWVGLAGGSAADFTAHGFDTILDLQLRVGISEFCGITEATVHVVYDTLTEPDLAGLDEAVTRTGGPRGAGDELARVAVGGSTVALRRADKPDLPSLIELLAADQLGAHRESAEDLGPYEAAFAAIDADPAQLLVVATADGRIVGTFQLSFIPGLARRGALRAQIEAVRVADEYRNRGLGAAMMRWAIEETRRRGCALVQLTSDKTRLDAHRFYEKLGFVRSHDGFKLRL